MSIVREVKSLVSKVRFKKIPKVSFTFYSSVVLPTEVSSFSLLAYCLLRSSHNLCMYYKQSMEMDYSSKVKVTLPSLLEVSDAFQQIVGYLKPREFYNLTLSSKAIHRSSKLTLSLVIQVCLLCGNKHTKVSLERIYSKVLSNAIHVPSARRLLFLLASNTCECCGVKKVNFVSDYGILLCLSCKKAHTTQIDIKSPKLLKSNVEINDLMAHPGVYSMVHHFVREAPYNYESNRLPVCYMLSEPCFDMKQRNIGPVMTTLHLNEMLQLPSYIAVESYVEYHKPNQINDRLEFINAMMLHREKCLILQQQKENLRILSVKRYRLNKFKNTHEAIALLRRNIPDGLKFALNYRTCTSFFVRDGVSRYSGPQVMHPYYSIIGSVQIDNVRVMLNEGPPNGKVFIRIMNGNVRRIVQPLIKRPTNFNDGTNVRHQERLLCLAREICMYFGAATDAEYPATWN